MSLTPKKQKIEISWYFQYSILSLHVPCFKDSWNRCTMLKDVENMATSRPTSFNCARLGKMDYPVLLLLYIFKRESFFWLNTFQHLLQHMAGIFTKPSIRLINAIVYCFQVNKSKRALSRSPSSLGRGEVLSGLQRAKANILKITLKW